MTPNSRWEFEDQMKSMRLAVGSQEWRDYAKEFVIIERGKEEPEETEPIHGSRVGSAAEPREPEEREPEEGLGEDMRAREDYEQAEEGRAVKTTRPAACPSDSEWRARRVTHYPYRSWCPYCRTARGVAGKHKRGDADVVNGTEFRFDYFVLRNAKAGDTATALVGTDRDSGGVIAHVVPQKGTVFDWVAERLESDIQRFGHHGRLVLRSDGENAIKYLMSELCRSRREAPTVMEHSPRYESKSNGRAENAVKRIEGQVRTLKLALEAAIGQELEVTHPIFEWLVEHCADLLTKCTVGADGKTPYERIKNKAYKGTMYEFGSMVLARLPGKPQ